ncbi:MAG: trypsin-like peptidase domain-containing protein [Clostridia bacterium]|jgi:Do/DeqQ family serine protease|nr:trypsin-like peptidase domain-containing protein [Clostridia bacterium]MDH7573764.1 trypsin-like peptidase domain-containing protein [Clostridia bacterium]
MRFAAENRVSGALAVLLVLTLVLTVGFLLGGCSQPAALADNPPPPASDSASSGGSGTAVAAVPPGVGPNTIADIVSKAGPAVVKIDTITRVGGSNPFFNDPFFRRFFGVPFQLGPQVQQGVGSGFLISADGYILTNEHVIDQAQEIKVTVAGYDTPFEARVVGSDYDLDLAVLKIDGPRAFPYLELGDSDAVRVGEWVIAIGNPYGLDHTVTVGVISAKGRPVPVEDRLYENMLQTDASINPGNSGGPLLNLQGRVVGINTAINAEAQGIGFAIPISAVKGAIETLKTKGQLVRPWLGVGIYDVTPDVAEYFGLGRVEGALVDSVESNSPAAKAGLRRGDIILEFNGQKITDADTLVKAIRSTKVGQQVKIKVWRLGKTIEITAVIAQKPAER